MESGNNYIEVIPTNVLAYADRYQSKFAWDKGHREKGYYLPDLTTYKWSWGIKLSLSNKLPKRDNIKTVQKKIVKASREECVEIINQHDPELMVDSENPRTSRRPKRNTCWSIVSSIINPSLVSAIKSRSAVLASQIVSFLFKGRELPNQAFGIQNQDQMEDQVNMIRQFNYFQDRQVQGTEKLKDCVICQTSFPYPMFTECCSVVLHKKCYDRLGNNPRCPTCSKQGFKLTHIPEHCDRVFVDIEMDLESGI